LFSLGKSVPMVKIINLKLHRLVFAVQVSQFLMDALTDSARRADNKLYQDGVIY